MREPPAHPRFVIRGRARFDAPGKKATPCDYSYLFLTFDNIKTVSIGTVPTTETQCRPLASLPAPQQREVWNEAVEAAPDGKVTAAHVAMVVGTIIRPAGQLASFFAVHALICPGKK
ncbi:MAG: hypothetical protein LLG97_18735 [Deltaproteobacteria bacterium]|nr:hypothetical protein [Deltaproteobacteria bacterium]